MLSMIKDTWGQLVRAKFCIVESFYSVNYVNINYFVKYSTADCTYLLSYNIFSLYHNQNSIENANCNVADCLKKHLETHKQVKCWIICQETIRKLIDGLERLGL